MLRIKANFNIYGSIKKSIKFPQEDHGSEIQEFFECNWIIKFWRREWQVFFVIILKSYNVTVKFNWLFFDVSKKIAKLSYLSELVSSSASFNVIADIIFPGSSEYYLNWNYFSHYNSAKGKIPFPADFTFTILAVGEKFYPRQVTMQWRTFCLSLCLTILVSLATDKLCRIAFLQYHCNSIIRSKLFISA